MPFQYEAWRRFLTYQCGIQYIWQGEYSWDFKERTTELLTPLELSAPLQFFLFYA